MENRVVISHRIMRRENFEKAANDLFKMLKSAQIKFPDRPRVLSVKIEGHKNKNGGFDKDMIELQMNFGLDFLGKYFTEINFPLYHVKNTNPQCNDIPDVLEIFNQKNRKDNSLNELYIENYSNTEFMSEPDVYNYLKKVHAFLIDFADFDFNYNINKKDNGIADICLNGWKRHISDLINELFTVFLYGNLLSAAAMTRTLIECFVYFKILSQDDNQSLIHEWYLCSLCYSLKENEILPKLFKEYCTLNNLDFDEKWAKYKNVKNSNNWLCELIPSKRLSFKSICNYLKDEQIYKDFENACAFVHGQDITSKMLPFTFYESISYRFKMMMEYIYKTILLFPLNEKLAEEIKTLRNDLSDLVKKY